MIKRDVLEAERTQGHGEVFPFVIAVARKAQIPFRDFLWHCDILAAARTGVTRTEQSEDTGFEKAKHMQWRAKGSGIQQLQAGKIPEGGHQKR